MNRKCSVNHAEMHVLALILFLFWRESHICPTVPDMCFGCHAYSGLQSDSPATSERFKPNGFAVLSLCLQDLRYCCRYQVETMLPAALSRAHLFLRFLTFLVFHCRFGRADRLSELPPRRCPSPNPRLNSNPLSYAVCSSRGRSSRVTPTGRPD